MTHYEQYLTRLMNLKQPNDDVLVKYRNPLFLLFQEYYKRIMYWQNGKGYRWLHNTALIYDDTVIVNIDDIPPSSLVNILRSNSIISVANMLSWAKLRDKYPNKYDRLDPYEPLILFYELGDRFHMLEHPLIDFDSGLYATTLFQAKLLDVNKTYINPTMEAVNAICRISDKE